MSESHDHDHNHDKDEDRFLQRLTSTLDQTEHTLDDATLRQLRLARHKAVEASEKKAHSRWLLPVSGLATAATVAVLTISLWLVPPENKPGDALPALEDIALLGDAESLEFYEDLDFYLWLDDEQKSG